jgi:hypothetical protein
VTALPRLRVASWRVRSYLHYPRLREAGWKVRSYRPARISGGWCVTNHHAYRRV